MHLLYLQKYTAQKSDASLLEASGELIACSADSPAVINIEQPGSSEEHSLVGRQGAADCGLLRRGAVSSAWRCTTCRTQRYRQHLVAVSRSAVGFEPPTSHPHQGARSAGSLQLLDARAAGAPRRHVAHHTSCKTITFVANPLSDVSKLALFAQNSELTQAKKQCGSRLATRSCPTSLWARWHCSVLEMHTLDCTVSHPTS